MALVFMSFFPLFHVPCFIATSRVARLIFLKKTLVCWLVDVATDRKARVMLLRFVSQNSPFFCLRFFFFSFSWFFSLALNFFKKKSAKKNTRKNTKHEKNQEQKNKQKRQRLLKQKTKKNKTKKTQTYTKNKATQKITLERYEKLKQDFFFLKKRPPRGIPSPRRLTSVFLIRNITINRTAIEAQKERKNN